MRCEVRSVSVLPMTKHIYPLIIIRHYKHIGDTLSVLVYDTKEKAEESAQRYKDQEGAYESTSVAVSEILIACGSEKVMPSAVSLTYGLGMQNSETSKANSK